MAANPSTPAACDELPHVRLSQRRGRNAAEHWRVWRGKRYVSRVFRSREEAEAWLMRIGAERRRQQAYDDANRRWPSLLSIDDAAG